MIVEIGGTVGDIKSLPSLRLLHLGAALEEQRRLRESPERAEERAEVPVEAVA